MRISFHIAGRRCYLSKNVFEKKSEKRQRDKREQPTDDEKRKTVKTEKSTGIPEEPKENGCRRKEMSHLSGGDGIC